MKTKKTLANSSNSATVFLASTLRSFVQYNEKICVEKKWLCTVTTKT